MVYLLHILSYLINTFIYLIHPPGARRLRRFAIPIPLPSGGVRGGFRGVGRLQVNLHTSHERTALCQLSHVNTLSEDSVC